ncbi:hypothetical protein M0R45_027079 [Rubus argutus]|uniref:Uncharacterized protein n=1 Tax=Rubus argutus TaxID=59490 RepID=A0AAW1X0T2_RUBAR
MATYTELHQSEIGQHLSDISSSAILDHGSISFGRFAAESLAWEKWSVFRHKPMSGGARNVQCQWIGCPKEGLR